MSTPWAIRLTGACLLQAWMTSCAWIPAPEPVTTDTGTAPITDTTTDTGTELPPSPLCGNGRLDEEEECDEGEDNADDAACTLKCVEAFCGDGLVWSGVEDCDDGNAIEHDGCSVDCEGPVVVDLSVASLELQGEEDNDQAGFSISGPGDVNGDGFDDILVGAPYHDTPLDQNVGAAYLIYGPVSGERSLEHADAKLYGAGNGDHVGIVVTGAGDVNGDGNADLLIGADRNDEGGVDAGAAYVFFDAVQGLVPAEDAELKLIGEAAGDFAGGALASAGDLNADGFDDILVGAFLSDANARDAGVVYIVHGSADPGRVSLADAHAKILGEERFGFVGFRVAGAGDTSGDGVPDLLISSPFDDGAGFDSGAAYLFLGGPTGTVSIDSADAKLVGAATFDQAGIAVAGAGDVDGDGLDDMLISAWFNDAGELDAGAVYMVSSSPLGIVPLVESETTVVGSSRQDFTGNMIANAGDVDGNGTNDILIGAERNDAADFDAGAAFLFLSPVSGVLSVEHADVILTGEESQDRAGFSVAGAGDVDNDGRADLLIGAIREGGVWDSAGSTSLFLGGGL